MRCSFRFACYSVFYARGLFASFASGRSVRPACTIPKISYVKAQIFGMQALMDLSRVLCSKDHSPDRAVLWNIGPVIMIFAAKFQKSLRKCLLFLESTSEIDCRGGEIPKTTVKYPHIFGICDLFSSLTIIYRDENTPIRFPLPSSSCRRPLPALPYQLL